MPGHKASALPCPWHSHCCRLSERALKVRDFAAEAEAARAAELRAAIAAAAGGDAGGGSGSSDQGEVCGVCLDVAEQPGALVAPCGHVFCCNCISEVLKEEKR